MLTGNMSSILELEGCTDAGEKPDRFRLIAYPGIWGLTIQCVLIPGPGCVYD